jgi:farnesyl diphosphate synthase
MGFVSDMVRAGAELSHQHYQTFIDHYDIDAGVTDPPSGLDETMRAAIADLVGYATAGFAAILTRAFEVLSQPLTHGDAGVRSDLVLALALASGSEGMCGGQMMDLAAEGQTLDIGAITRLQRLKTGALIGFAAQAGAILGKAPVHVRHTLVAFAHDLGLAFQIADDLIDVEGSASAAGKATGKDEARGKATFVSILGGERARAQAQLLADQAARPLDLFDAKADRLRALTRWAVRRQS